MLASMLMTPYQIMHISWLPGWACFILLLGYIAIGLLLIVARFIVPCLIIVFAAAFLWGLTKRFADYLLNFFSNIFITCFFALGGRRFYQQKSSSEQGSTQQRNHNNQSSHDSRQQDYWQQHNQQQQQQRQQQQQKKSEEAFDPYSILGISRTATRTEIVAGYKEQMKLYHPDRVQHLGEILRKAAHERTLAIQAAYEALLGQKMRA